MIGHSLSTISVNPELLYLALSSSTPELRFLSRTNPPPSYDCITAAVPDVSYFCQQFNFWKINSEKLPMETSQLSWIRNLNNLNPLVSPQFWLLPDNHKER